MGLRSLLSLQYVNRVALVPAGANAGARIALAKGAWGDEEYIAKRSYTTDQLVAMAKKGQAIPIRNDDGEIVDGRYPIADAADLSNAVQAYGRGSPSDKSDIAKHIVKRARALGALDKVGDTIKEAAGSKTAKGGDFVVKAASCVHCSESLPSEVVDRAGDSKTVTCPSCNKGMPSGLVTKGLTLADAQRLHSVMADQLAKVQKEGRKMSTARYTRLQAAHKELGDLLAEVTTPPKAATDDKQVDKGDPGKEVPMPEEPAGNEPAFDKATLSEEAQSYLAKVEADRDKAAADLAAANKRAEDAEAKVAKEQGDQPTDQEQAIQKALDDPAIPDATKAILKAQHTELVETRKRADEAVAKADQEERIRLDAEAVTKMAPVAQHLGIDVAKVAPALRLFAKASPEAATVIEEGLKAVSEQLKANNVLLTTLGKSGGSGGTAWERIEAAAAELRKAHPDWTVEKARDEVMQQNPKLAADYREEAGIASGGNNNGGGA